MAPWKKEKPMLAARVIATAGMIAFVAVTFHSCLPEPAPSTAEHPSEAHANPAGSGLPDARLEKVLRGYNIVSFNGKVYGVPQGVEVNWKTDDLPSKPGMVVEQSVDAVEKLITSLPDQGTDSQEPHLVKVV